MSKEVIRWIIVALAMSTSPFSAVPAHAAAAAEQPRVVHQLRVYEIFEHNKSAFHERFRDHAVRIMAKYDFKILAIWETQHQGRTEFVYLLQWPDRQTLTDRWTKFMADPEWADIKKRTGAVHGRLVGEIQDRVLDVQDYSPNKTFSIEGAR